MYAFMNLFMSYYRMERTHDRETIVEMPMISLSPEEEIAAADKYHSQMNSKEVAIRWETLLS